MSVLIVRKLSKLSAQPLHPPTDDPPVQNCSEPAFRALIRTFGLLRRVQEPFFNRLGVSASQAGVLVAIHRAEREGMSWLRLTDLGDRLIIRPPSVTGVVDRLVKMGLVERTSVANDRRAKVVSLTDAGREMVARLRDAMPGQAESILSALSPEERELLRHLLELLGTRLQGMANELEKENHHHATRTA